MSRLTKWLVLAVFLVSVGIAISIEQVETLDIEGTKVDPGQVQTPRDTWEILADTLQAGDEPTDLSVTERTYQKVVTAIAADASGDGKISIFDVPRSWNAVRLRAIGGTDGHAITYQIYLGTLGVKHSTSPADDCDLAYLGQFAFTVGTQESIYASVGFLGGSIEIAARDTIEGSVSGETAVVVSISDLSSGSWAGGDAAGTLQLRTQSGAFQSENLILYKPGQTVAINSDAASILGDLTDIEFADTLTVTESDWPMSVTTKSPTGNRVAETTVDLMGADIIVLVPTAISSGSKMLGKGY